MSVLRFLVVLGLVVLAGQAPAAWAQLKPGGAGRDSKGPIAISADRMESDDPAGVVNFIGAVVARQGDMTITCDRMKVIYVHQDKAAQPEKAPAEEGQARSPLGGSDRQIDRVECDGNVKVVEGERMAVGQKALYLAQSLPRRIVLTGEARVWQGRDSLTGHQVTYNLDDSRSLVESGQRERVRAVYHQGDDK